MRSKGLATSLERNAAAAAAGEGVTMLDAVAKENDAGAAFWMNLFDSHPDPLMYLSCDHRVIRVNEAQAKVLGCRAEEVVGRFCFEFMHGNSGLAEGCPYAGMVRENHEQTAEVMFERLPGCCFLVTVKSVFDAEGRRVGLLHVARDITARKVLERELRGACDSFCARVEARAMELRNRLLFDRLLVMMARRLAPSLTGEEMSEMIAFEVARVVDALGFGRCVLWAAQGDDETLRVVAQYEDASVKLPFLPDVATRASDPFLFGVAERDGYVRTAVDGVVRCATGMNVPASAIPSFVLLVECREHSSGCDFLYEDVLRLMCEILGSLMRRTAEASEMRLLKRKLLQADRVARTGQLAAALAHELNQPLAASLCNAQAAVRLLAQETPDMVETRAALNDIVEDVRRAGTVMRHTRSLFTGGQAHRQAVDLNLIVNTVLGIIRSDISLTEVTVKADLEVALPQVWGDEIQLQQVVRNLLWNAYDAVCGKPKSEQVIRIRTGVTESGAVELCVKDSGVGVTEGMEDKIFEPFFTTKPQGQGMGLSICQQIVQSHEGTIRAERLPECGTCFRIRLPLFTGKETR